jgi:hypothetical protein
VEIVKAVYGYRVLTTHQIQALLFPSDGKMGISSRCQYRLQLLFHQGYLWRDELPTRLSEGRRPLIYFLDTKGAQLLAELAEVELDELDWNPKHNDANHSFLEHLMATNNVRVAVTVAARRLGWSIGKWIDDRGLKSPQMKTVVTLTGPQGGKRRTAVVPDGYFVLDNGTHVYHHFLEVDLCTVTGEASAWGRRDWARKVAAYLEYYRSGQYQAHYGTPSLRVLTVTTGERRLQNLKAITERVGGKARFWFTTFEDVDPARVLTHPIWQVAGRQGTHTLTW